MVPHPSDDAARSTDDEGSGNSATPVGDDTPAAQDAAGGQSEDQHQSSDSERAAADEEWVRRTRTQVIDCIQNPADSANKLPYLLSYLESEDQIVRWLSATACCLIAVEADDDEILEYLVRRLTDRLTAEGISLELTTALDYLSSAFADEVAPLLVEIGDDESELLVPEVGNFTRSYYYGQEFGRDGVGRVRMAGANTEENPHHVVADNQREEREQIEYARRRRKLADEDDKAEEDDETTAGIDPDQLAGNSTTMVKESATVSTIADQSQFDELYIQGERSRGRYATTYEALVGEAGERRAAALRLLHQPDPRDSLSSFGRDLAEQIARWQVASDHENVVTVFDWGVGARAWVATELIEDLLAERDRASQSVACDHALSLVSAVAHLHQNDVVHGGIDPQTVAYPGEQFYDDDDVEEQPLLNNVGLVNVFRYYFEPADCLDPRFAAPEYYDDRFGKVDHATDIYQLGAVCYRLFTGRPPFAGDFQSIREHVLSQRPPPPSSVEDELPSELDDVLAKTMAKQKLRRYETVEQFQGELAGLAAEFGSPDT